MKRHQMRFYFRMREIESICFSRCADDPARSISSPRIDSSWSHAGKAYSGTGSPDYQPIQHEGPRRSYQLTWFFPQVFLPHAVAFFVGVILLVLGIRGTLGQMTW